MDTIGKSKIVDYIRQYPELASTIVFTYKEFPYRMKSQSRTGVGNCDMQLGASGYWLRYSTNLWLQTASVSCFGTNEDLEQQQKAELERYLAANPGAKLVTKQVTITVTPPAPKLFARQTAATAPIPVAETEISTVETNNISRELLPHEQLNTTAEYNAAFERATIIFKSEPDTPEFDELATLLSQIRHYERTHILLPKLTPPDVIKLKMTERGVSNRDLARVLRTKENNVSQLLNGIKPFSEQRLAKLFNYFRVPYLINNPEFFA